MPKISLFCWYWSLQFKGKFTLQLLTVAILISVPFYRGKRKRCCFADKCMMIMITEVSGALCMKGASPVYKCIWYMCLCGSGGGLVRDEGKS